MATITFNKVGEQYVAEFEASADFNLHIEGVLTKDFVLLQRSTGSQYDVIADKPNYLWSNVFDYDFTALVYPKTIKIVSEVEPTYASIVSSGEITEIKSQSKSVEIVANGTTNISPDAGYSYLSGVSVKVNVPQEGGGSIDAKYLGLGVVNINEGYTGLYAFLSEYPTWEETIDSSEGTNLFISNGYVHFREDYLLSYPLYYDAELTQMVSETDKPLSQDYYIEGYSGGASGN